MRTWQIKDAKAKLGHIMDLAKHSGPQVITCRGEEVAVVVSVEEYKRACQAQAGRQDRTADALEP